MEMLKTSLALL